ncbi:hypothetical protein PIB30_110515 [Stylosanthes scabra]|uniref:Aminotransferase-like plant mobile domain-containing protein n=1 Tax=Stylosanthes scabra TaxID=79078 RepID=A0ABU6VZ99_9FABA|nr:hypothetical protein [Stylosanthes scabra]
MSYAADNVLFVVPAKFISEPHSDFYTAVVPLIFFRFIEVLNVDRVSRQFGGKQSPPRPPLNIDTFHKTSARNDDGWWPSHLQEWFVVWNNRRTKGRRLRIHPAMTLLPSRKYFAWYRDRTRRFLSADTAFYDPHAGEVPPDTPSEYEASPAVAWPDVPLGQDVPPYPPTQAFQQDEAPPQPPPPAALEGGFLFDPQYYCPHPYVACASQYPTPMYQFFEGASSYHYKKCARYRRNYRRIFA